MLAATVRSVYGIVGRQHYLRRRDANARHPDVMAA
jgi:hypothetical protein